MNKITKDHRGVGKVAVLILVASLLLLGYGVWAAPPSFGGEVTEEMAALNLTAGEDNARPDDVSLPRQVNCPSQAWQFRQVVIESDELLVTRQGTIVQYGRVFPGEGAESFTIRIPVQFNSC